MVSIAREDVADLRLFGAGVVGDEIGVGAVFPGRDKVVLGQ